MTKAYSYSRFSSDAQRQGTSIDRQQSLARKWCEENAVELSKETFADEAVSGFHGANLATGALSKFIAHVETGEIERGSYLILENLDRLTRLNAWDASGLLQKLVSLGIVVVTLRPLMRFDHGSTAIDLLQAILHMDNAHKESARKSDFGKLEWEKRFARARESNHHIGRRVSNWLTLDEHGKYRLNEKADTVRRIFAMCLEGHGSMVIAQKLNAEVHPTFNRGERWGTSAVLTILQNRAAIGELAPKDGGEAIQNYFDPVVDQDTFDAAQSIIHARKTGKVTRQAGDINVWSKLVFCGACGSAMHIIQRSKFRYLMCANRRYGECKGSRNVRVDEGDDIFMAVLLELDAMALVKPDPDKLARELSVVEGRLIAEQEKLKRLANTLESNPDSPTVLNLVLLSEGRVKAFQREVARLTDELTGGEKLNWSEFKTKINLTDRDTRKRANAYLHRLGVKMHVADGYLITQRDAAIAMFVVAKGKIGSMSLEVDADVAEIGSASTNEMPDTVSANAIALTIKNLLLQPSGGFVYRGMLTVPNGRGTRRAKQLDGGLAQT